MKINNPDILRGLTDKEVDERIKKDLINKDISPKTKSIVSIIKSNLFTLFNFINLVLGVLVFFTGSFKNLLFLGVAICNVMISTYQAIRTKKIVDKLSIISETKVLVLRNNEEKLIGQHELVLDDIVIYKAGNQIVCDCVVLKGSCEVNESLVTGESDNISKKENDTLLSGSYVINSKVYAKVIHIKEDNYASKITLEAKYIKKVNSQIYSSLNIIIRNISFVIVPLGIVLYINQFNLTHSISSSILASTAALISMIPEGLVLLTSSVLAVSTYKLAKQNVLVQELFCIETLARVDTICFDKTGTLTLGTQKVKKEVVLNKNVDSKNIMQNLINSFEIDSVTMDALNNYYDKKSNLKVTSKTSFSSDKKYSTITFEDEYTYYLGAPDILCSDLDISKYNKNRVILLARKKDKMEPLLLIILEETIRLTAQETLEYFAKQGVNIKVISGDKSDSVKEIASTLNLSNKKNIDTSTLSDEELYEKASQYDIFGRVKPHQKKIIIQSLKNSGHVVAYVGDGVNDVLALKESDSSIALSSGSDVTRNIANIILIDSNFEVIPKIVEEGRKSINNIERSSSLFLSKTVYAIILGIVFCLIPINYPFVPIQLTLVNVLTIGIPSFILALEPNYNRVKGSFFKNVLKNSLPIGIVSSLSVISLSIYMNYLNINEIIISQVSTIVLGLNGFLLIYNISKPFNKLRRILIIALMLIFLICITIFKTLFDFTTLSTNNIIIILVTFIICLIIYIVLDKAISKRK